MSTTYFPRNNPERDLCISRLGGYRDDADPNPILVMLDQTACQTSREAYVAARDAWADAISVRRNATAAASAAEAAFDRDLRTFAGTVRDAEGRNLPRVLSDLLGGKLPSDVLQASSKEKVQRTSGLVRRLSGRTDLRYDAAAAADLEVSTAALELAVLADKRAGAALLAAGTALASARDAFDVGYKKLVTSAKALLPESLFTCVFERFTRVNDTEDAAEDDTVTAVETGTPAPEVSAPVS